MRNPFSRPGNLHGLFEDFIFHRFLAQHPLKFTDRLERIIQLLGWHHVFVSADRGEVSVLTQLASQEKLFGIDVIAPSEPEIFCPG